MGLVNLRMVQDGLANPREGTRRVGVPSRRFGTYWETIQEVWNGSGDPLGGPGRVGDLWVSLGRVRGPLGKSGMGQGTLWEVLDRPGDPP